MTITRRWQSGMESNRWSASISEFDAITGTPSPTSSSTRAKSGSYSLYTGGNLTDNYASKTITTTAQIRCGFHVFVSAANRDDSGLWGAWASSPVVHLQRPDENSINLVINGSTKDTYTFSVPQTDWKHIGIDCNTDSGSGWAVIYIDGEEVMRYEGSVTGSSISTVRFGGYANTTDTFYDDMFIDDTTGEAAPAPVPDRRFIFLSASDNGTYSEGMGSDGNSASNYLLVDDYPHDGDTTYISVSAADIKETYNLSTYTAPSGFLFAAVIPVAYVKKLEASTDTGLGMLIRTGGSDSESASLTLPTSYGYTWSRFTAKPDSGSWAQADIDDLETGYAGAGTF